jgi:hypothetical protein
VNAVIRRAFFFHPSTNIRDTVAVCLDKRKRQTAQRDLSFFRSAGAATISGR